MTETNRPAASGNIFVMRTSDRRQHNKVVNLTDPNDIVAAMKKKGGKGGVTLCAHETGYKLPYISQHIHQVRECRDVLQAMADWLGCGIYGVLPDEPAEPETGEKEER